MNSDLNNQFSNEQQRGSTLDIGDGAKEKDDQRVVSFALDDAAIGTPTPSGDDNNDGVEDRKNRPATRMNLSQIAKGTSFIVRSTPQLFDVNRGVSVDRAHVAEVVTGLTSPMDPLERKRLEFFDSDRSGSSRQDPSSPSRPEECPQFRLRSKMVRRRIFILLLGHSCFDLTSLGISTRMVEIQRTSHPLIQPKNGPSPDQLTPTFSGPSRPT
jgi:hypothetical protein